MNTFSSMVNGHSTSDDQPWLPVTSIASVSPKADSGVRADAVLELLRDAIDRVRSTVNT